VPDELRCSAGSGGNDRKAGGIGFLINQSIKLFQFDVMLNQILIVLVLVVVVDNVSAVLRRRVT
jgi:phosphonate transport system permease protein